MQWGFHQKLYPCGVFILYSIKNATLEYSLLTHTKNQLKISNIQKKFENISSAMLKLLPTS